MHDIEPGNGGHPSEPGSWELTNSGRWFAMDATAREKEKRDYTRAKLLWIVVSGALSALAAGVVMASCENCLQVGTWNPPYQTKTEAVTFKNTIDAKFETNAKSHKKIRAAVNDSRDTIVCYITTPAKLRAKCAPKSVSDTDEE